MLPGTGNCATWRCKVTFLLATQAPILAFVGDKTKLMPNSAHETDAMRMARRKIQAQKMVTVSTYASAATVPVSVAACAMCARGHTQEGLTRQSQAEGEGWRAALGPTRDVLGCGAKRQTLQATVKIALICPIARSSHSSSASSADSLRMRHFSEICLGRYTCRCNIPRSVSAVLMQMFMLITGLLIRISFKYRVRLAD